MGPRQLHRLVATAEAVTWALLLTGMVLKYVTRTTDVGVSIGGGLHGFVFLAYLVTTVLVAVDGRWPARATVLGLASAVLPFTTLPFERWARRRDLLADRWRLRQAAGGGPLERLVGLVLRRPVLASVVTVAALTLVFAGLVRLGPPTTWFA
ncbi:DUF3817 domain-containing protein [Auraticoccus sp. F435]|uniref:DUF3817 domain-containing protein n=1 Tax=Auraticoccus cholistanensis TaxID=2656650 RepID=A0A6A9UYK1_9ACTN|nr:DUF3817 domain-containing protein [Auraticoccus cholistanensis]MVA76884.1 DUF3817 domain-containing protein [Auraticoccus cholistanensis]